MMTINFYILLKKKQYFFLLFSTLFLLQATSYSQVTVILQVQPPLCGGINNGVITANPSGGIAPYTFLWSNGSSANPITNLPPATYSVTVTSANGLTGTASTTLTAPPPLTVDPVVTNCGLPGAMTAIVSGGVTPYSYEWSNNATTQSISNLNPGNYCVTVVDNNTCAFFICESIGTLLSASVNTNDILCGAGNGGSAQALVSGGVTPYTYLWSNGATTPTITNLQQGIYTVTATAANGCTISASGTVGYQPGGYNISLSINHPTCPGTSNGSITASAAGGHPPHTYTWSNNQSGATISNLAPGTYTVTSTDSYGCTATQSATLNYQSNLNATLTTWNPSCSNSNNGSISANPTGGILPYSFLWSTGVTTQTLNNVGAGNYTVTVSDVLGCTTVKSATLTAPQAMTATVTGTNATNCGVANGMATAVPGGGGSPPFSYIWSNGASTNVITGLMAGTYTVTISSVAGCTASGSVIISQPNTLNISLTGSSLVCGSANNGTLTANITYGTPPYGFAWSNGGSTQTINNLPAGTYVVTVTSSQGCIGTASKTIAGSPPISLNATVENVKCYGTATGKITANASGGTPPLSYHWSHGASGPIANNLLAGTYTLTIVDGLGCQKVEPYVVTQPNALAISFNHSGGSCGSDGHISTSVSGGTQPVTLSWSSGQTESVIFNLPPGNYTLTVTDANNCQAIASQALTSFPAVHVTAAATNTTCNGTTDGAATATVNAGTAPFQFIWNNSDTTSHLDSLSPGIYQVTVIDDNGCKSSDTVEVQLGAGLNLTIEGTYFICPGNLGEATVTPSGGTPPYNFLWSNGQTNQTAIDLTPSNYKVTVTDQLGCNGEANIIILPGGGFGVNWAFENASCFGSATGSAQVGITSGGSPPFDFLWSNGDTLPEIDSLLAGEYVVTITDSTGCSSLQLFNIGQPNLLQVEVEGFNGSCGGNGYANANVSGGSNPFNYKWSNDASTQSIGNLAPGSYTLTVTDAHQCTAVDSTLIELIPIPVCNIELTQPVGAINGSDGQLTVQLDAGANPFTVKWSDGQITPTATGLSPGNHIATITDANNCIAICNFQLFNPGEIGDFAWLDADKDGIQDVAETGLAGAQITLLGVNQYGDTVSVETTSNAAGAYQFIAQPGVYKLLFMPPAGYANSPFNQTGNDAFDSDPNPQTFATAEFALGQGESNLLIDGGFFVAEPCENFTSAGSICCDQTLCGPGQPVAELTETAAPAGGSGEEEFLWMSSILPPPFDLATWTPMLDADAASLDPGLVQQTTWFIRLARRKGCIEYLESNIAQVAVDSVAIAEIVATDTTCLDVPVSFSAAGNGIGAAYSWKFEGAVPDTANAQHVHGVTWAELGEKNVTLSVSKDGCTSMDELKVFVSNIPVYCGDALIINAKLESDTSSKVVVDWYYSFTDSVSRIYSVEWKWGDNDFVKVGEVDSSAQFDSYLHYFAFHNTPKRGKNYYRVRLNDSNGTELISNEVEVIYKGEYSLVHVFPNPFSGDLQVEILDRYERKITLELISPEGKLVGIYEAPVFEDSMTLPTKNLPPGFYFLFVKYDREPQKIVKLVKWRQ